MRNKPVTVDTYRARRGGRSIISAKIAEALGLEPKAPRAPQERRRRLLNGTTVPVSTPARGMALGIVHRRPSGTFRVAAARPAFGGESARSSHPSRKHDTKVRQSRVMTLPKDVQVPAWAANGTGSAPAGARRRDRRAAARQASK